MACDDMGRLISAVRQPVAALTAVEVDDAEQAEDLVRQLKAELKNRPNRSIFFSAATGATQLLDDARNASKSWEAEKGGPFSY